MKKTAAFTSTGGLSEVLLLSASMTMVLASTNTFPKQAGRQTDRRTDRRTDRQMHVSPVSNMQVCVPDQT